MAGSSSRILILEPYFGGSHRAFLESLQRNLPFSFELLTLPARKWKWRMRLAAPYFAEKLRHLRPCPLLCSAFVDVAVLRGLAPTWVSQAPILTYFHENQFAYPVQTEQERDIHFALTNLTTALASDRLAFNSRHNLHTFLDGIAALQQKGCDFELTDPRPLLRAKSTILPPGLEFADIDREERRPAAGAPVIVWNHRWEHDKDPHTFFRALFQLAEMKIEFQLVVLGQSFRERPPIFKEAARRLAPRLLHFGYVKSRREYIRWLKRGDLVVSTARHEFFGLAVLEAVRAGCRPLLPRRLSYPELFPEAFLYEEEAFTDRLIQAVRAKQPLSAAEATALTEPFSWAALAPAYGAWLRASGSTQGDSTAPSRVDFSEKWRT